MECMYFKKCILNKALPSISLMTGDRTLLNIYRNKIYEMFNVKKLPTVLEYLNKKHSKLFQDDKNTIYIIEDDFDFKTQQTLWGSEFENLVLIYEDIEKDSKFQKAFESNIITFEEIPKELLKGVIKNRLNINKDSIEWILKACNYNYDRCLNEVDKIKIFDKGHHQQLFDKFKKENIIHIDKEVGQFELSNAVTNRDKRLSIELLEILNDNDCIGHLSIIYRALKTGLIVKATPKWTEDTGVSSKQFAYLSKNIKYTLKELEEMLIFIPKIINKIRVGYVTPKEAIYLFILQYL